MAKFFITTPELKAMAALCNGAGKHDKPYKKGLHIHNGWAWTCDGVVIMAIYHGDLGQGFTPKETLVTAAKVAGKKGAIGFDTDKQTCFTDSFTANMAENPGRPDDIIRACLGSWVLGWEDTRVTIVAPDKWKKATDFSEAVCPGGGLSNWRVVADDKMRPNGLLWKYESSAGTPLYVVLVMPMKDDTTVKQEDLSWPWRADK